MKPCIWSTNFRGEIEVLKEYVHVVHITVYKSRFGICTTRPKSINLDLKSKILPEIQLKPINFFHNYNRGINGLLGHKAQHFLCPKKKSGILTAILKKFIGFNFWVFV